MRINATNPAPGLTAEPLGSGRRTDPRPALPQDEVVRRPVPVHADTTSVVVEMQRDNTVVYKFIDGSSGQLIQQIPSQQMINFADAVEAALPALRKAQGQE